MGRQRSQIEIVERQISVVDHDIKVLLAELGLHIIALRQPVVPGDSMVAYQQLVSEKSVLDDYDARITHLQQIGQSLQDASARVASLRNTVVQHEKLLQIVFGRIGVIAWEEASSGVLSPVIKAVLPDIDQKQQRAVVLKQNKDSIVLKTQETSSILKITFKLQEFIASRRLDKFSRSNEEFFIQTGQTIAESHLTKHLESNATVKLDEEFHNLTREVEAAQDELSLLQKRITKDKSSLEEVGVAGSVERKIQELQNMRKNQAEVVQRLAVDYGKVICSLENPWKSEYVDAETLRVYDQIRRHERIRGQLETRIDELRIEQQIGELIFLIEEDEERIGHLRQLIDQYNRQIEDIQKDIGLRREQIVHMKHTLAKSLEQEVQ